MAIEWTDRGVALAGLALAFAIGVGGFHLLTEPLDWTWFLAPALVLLIAWLACGRGRRGRVLGLAAGFLAGIAWAQFQACLILCHPFPEADVRTDLVVEGRIASLPTPKGLAQRFLFRIDSTRRGETDIGFAGLARLSWYRDAPALIAGERWRLRVRLKPPHGYANPGGFDYERWLFELGVSATGTVREGPGNLRLDSGPGPYWLDRLRQGLREHIRGVLGDSPASGLVQALVLGERSAISQDQWEVLRRTGTNHLIAISGLHVGLVAGLAFFVGRRLWALSARLTLVLAAPRAAALSALAAALAYSALAGFSISTQRASVMLAVFLTALYWGRTPRPFAALALALGAVLVLDPQSVLSYGLWLSFGAVALLIYALGSRPLAWGGAPAAGEQDVAATRHAPAYLWGRWAAPQWAIGLGLWPTLLLLFGRASLIAPAVNLVAIPLFGLILPALLAAVVLSLVPGLVLPLGWMAQLLSWCLDGLGVLAGLPWATITVGERPAWAWVAAFVGAAMLLAPRGLPCRALGGLALLPLTLLRTPSPAQGEAWFSLLDVGQGLAAVVRTRTHTLVYDVGPAYPGGLDTGSAVVLPYLQQAGVERIDMLILSHADQDHAGGIDGLRAGLPVVRLLSGEPMLIPGRDARPCLADERWDWDGVGFEILYPPGPGLAGNDSSCVLRVFAGGSGVLLTGDIGLRAESGLVEAFGDGLATEVLVAAHHGSAGSTSSPFLAAVQPRYVLYATGFADRFGFPSRQVLARVAALGATQLDTGDLGAIRFRLVPGRGLEDLTWQRQDDRRLWTHVPGKRP